MSVSGPASALDLMRVFSYLLYGRRMSQIPGTAFALGAWASCQRACPALTRHSLVRAHLRPSFSFLVPFCGVESPNARFSSPLSPPMRKCNLPVEISRSNAWPNGASHFLVVLEDRRSLGDVFQGGESPTRLELRRDQVDDHRPSASAASGAHPPQIPQARIRIPSVR